MPILYQLTKELTTILRSQKGTIVFVKSENVLSMPAWTLQCIDIGIRAVWAIAAIKRRMIANICDLTVENASSINDLSSKIQELCLQLIKV